MKCFIFLSTICLVALSTATVRADDSRLVNEAIIEASIDDVWEAWTTKKGIESWMVAHADIELKVGGKMRTHYDPNGVLGDPNSIENTILCYDPKRMLSIKATKTPEKFPFKKAIEGMWTMIYLEELGPKRTKVTTVGLGFTNDPESQKMREFFKAGNAQTLEQLRKRFAPK